MENIQDLYTDYLLSSFGQVTSTGLSSVLDGSVSHDRITRHLSGGASGGKELWLSVKPFAKKHGTDDACVIFDDTIIEKPFSKVDEHNCYHYDHSKGRNVKGINLLNCLYHSESEKGACADSHKLPSGGQDLALLRGGHQKGKAKVDLPSQKIGFTSAWWVNISLISGSSFL